MIRKTMRIGEVRTSIKLEKEFWSYLKEVADERNLRLSALVNEIADATPDRTNLASTLRTFALTHARLRSQTQQRELEQLSLAGNTQIWRAYSKPAPCPAWCWTASGPFASSTAPSPYGSTSTRAQRSASAWTTS